ncbi:MAG: hypothetical protein ABSE71_04775 [Candidatus Micrarchaeaceae archaeon]|nr:hypothetical protein [Candidatus Micrarchaeota archaeon]HII09859.1 hypothetical protein [Candidatus Micrarchaeota archaeon]
MKKLAREFITSLITVILAILAIALYIHSGGTLVFYTVVVIAILVGFYNAWLISRGELKEVRETRPAPRKLKRRTSRRRKQ